jgi:hypothetical protein
MLHFLLNIADGNIEVNIEVRNVTLQSKGYKIFFK